MKRTPLARTFKSEPLDTTGRERVAVELKHDINFINYLDVDICVLDRRGIEITIPYKRSRGNNKHCLIIEEEYHMVAGSKLTVNQYEQSEGMKAIQDNLIDSMNADTQARRDNRKAGLRTVISLEDIRRDGENCIYLSDYDYVIYVPTLGVNIVHPMTVSKVINQFEIDGGNIGSTRLEIKLNDPTNKLGDCWVNFNGLIMKVIKKNSETLPPGAVITSTDEDGKILNIPLSLDEFSKKIRVYGSYEEADSYGNLEEMAKANLTKELEELKHNNLVESEKLKAEILDKKRENERLEHDLKTRDAEHKRKMDIMSQEFEREKHERDFESMRRKSYYEERSLDRKDSSELLKFLPMIVGAGLVLLFK